MSQAQGVYGPSLLHTAAGVVKWKALTSQKELRELKENTKFSFFQSALKCEDM